MRKNVKNKSNRSLGIRQMGIALVGLSAVSAGAADLKAPLFLENANVLPRFRGNPRLITAQTGMTERYDEFGQTQQLGYKLNKSVSWADVIGSQEFNGRPDVERQNALRGILAAAPAEDHVDPNQGPGRVTGQVNTFASVYVPALAFGLTERWTLAAALPVVNVDVNVATGFVANDQGRAVVRLLAEQSTVYSAEEASSKLNIATAQKAERLGYEAPVSKTVRGLGDLQLVSKYQFLNSEGTTLALKNTLFVPTGIAPNADALIDVPTGDGRVSLAAALVFDRELGWDTRFNGLVGMVWGVPRALDRRLPVSADDSMSRDKEKILEISRWSAQVGFGLEKRIPFLGLSFQAGYQFQYQTGAKYVDGQFESVRYRLLEDLNPDQQLQSLSLGIGFSTVEWFKQKKFIYPMQVNLGFSHPLQGKSLAKNDVFAGELVLFF